MALYVCVMIYSLTQTDLLMFSLVAWSLEGE